MGFRTFSTGLQQKTAKKNKGERGSGKGSVFNRKVVRDPFRRQGRGFFT
jgi:hypothetical protein